MSYTVIRSNRKRFALELGAKGLVVRAPISATDKQIRKLVQDHEAWIKKHMSMMEEAKRNAPPAERLTPDELRELAKSAVKVFAERAAYYAPLIGVTYNRITIRNQRTRWGSCSSKGNLNFNCLLMLAPPEVLDSVVVHELCHRKVPNHSDSFYEEVLKVFPDYRKWEKWLKENGAGLMRRMTGEE